MKSTELERERAQRERQRRRYALRSPTMHGLTRRVWQYVDVPGENWSDAQEPVTVIGDPLRDLELLSLEVEDCLADVNAALDQRGFGMRRRVRAAMRRLEDEQALIMASCPRVRTEAVR